MEAEPSPCWNTPAPDGAGPYTAIGGATAPMGALLATVVWAVTKSLGEDNLVDWGWRIPFAVSVLVVSTGVYARLRLSETPEFADLTEERRTARAPIVEVARQDWRRTVCIIGVNFGFTSFWYLLITWAPSYLSDTLKVAAGVSLVGMVASSLVQTAVVLAFGALSDRYGRKPIIVAGALFTALQAVPFFLLLQTRSPGLVILALAMAAIGPGAVLGPLLAFFCEQHPARRRYIGFSLGYQVGAALTGGLTAGDRDGAVRRVRQLDLVGERVHRSTLIQAESESGMKAAKRDGKLAGWRMKQVEPTTSGGWEAAATPLIALRLVPGVAAAGITSPLCRRADSRRGQGWPSIRWRSCHICWIRPDARRASSAAGSPRTACKRVGMPEQSYRKIADVHESGLAALERAHCHGRPL
ncbi:MFS family permease [Streptacidiphilus sp. BW17]|uniref:MFS transporter n=1 Tax=Streptacidiphilus sp. BW17 TaxID=3156274 RepID=UPI00351956DD